MWCPYHFPRGGENSALSSVESLNEASQSGHGSGLGIIGRASSLNHDDGGGAGLRDGSAAIDSTSEKEHAAFIDGTSEKEHAAERVKSALLNTELTPGSHGKSN